MVIMIGIDSTTEQLSRETVRRVLERGFENIDLVDKRILIIIPDGTRSGPIDLFFRLFYEVLWDHVSALDYLIALGTHRPMSEEAIRSHLGLSEKELVDRYRDVRVYNHRWDNPDTFRTLGTIPATEIETLSNGLLSKEVPIKINQMIFDYDLVVICGPVFPHEVVGFSGGNKYFFPGISGQEIIDITHWLGALITSHSIIGRKDTPVRAVIDRAAEMIDVDTLACCSVVEDKTLAGLYVDSPREAWSAAADLSAQVHVKYLEKPYRTVLSVTSEMYEDMWTAAKGMYKVEPIVADGGEVIIYAPHITEFSYTHGHSLDEIGYHVRDYFVKQWDSFKHYPWGVLAHSTHLRGIGKYEDGVEQPRIEVTLATRIPRERCERLNLGYRDPDTIDPEQWAKVPRGNTLVVPRAGEILYRLQDTN